MIQRIRDLRGRLRTARVVRYLPLLIAPILVGFVVFGASVRPQPSAPERSVPAVVAEAPTPTPEPQEADSAETSLPQAVEDEAEPFAALTEPVPEARPRRDGPVEYEVAEGDTLLQIAEWFGLRAETLVWANGLANSDLIVIGQKLRIPPEDGLWYGVQSGDRLWAIADRFGLSVGTIMTANRIEDADTLPAGYELWLPGARPVAPAVRAAVEAPSAEAIAAEEQLPLPENVDEVLSAGWLRAMLETPLYKLPGAGAPALQGLPQGARLERISDLVGRKVQVRDPGDGRTRQAMTGWVDVSTVEPGLAPAVLPRGYPQVARMDIAHVFVPYRTQLDGGPWAGANCGPAALSMVLAAFGVDVAPAQLRPAVLAAQGIYGHYTGTLLTALARVAERHGVAVHDLYEGGGLKRWTLDDIRAQLAQGRPVLAQVRFRGLPGYERVPYYGDHYIVITGALEEGFLYNDPLNNDGPGWDRVISNQRLYAAMDASDTRYRYTAFAAGAGG